MIEVTPAAADKLRELRGADPSRAYLRLWVAGRSCCGYQYSLAFDEKVERATEVVRYISRVRGHRRNVAGA